MIIFYTKKGYPEMSNMTSKMIDGSNVSKKNCSSTTSIIILKRAKMTDIVFMIVDLAF